MTILLFYTTHSSEEAAWQIANLLLEKKYVACANVMPIQSAYWWHGQIENDQEWIALFKTIPEMEKKVEEMILKHHPYDIPCIVRWPVYANQSYIDWITAAVDQKDNSK